MSTARIDILYQTQTSETTATKVLAPDGAGGVEFRAETGGSGISVTDGSTTVNPATSVDFTDSVTVTDGGGGVAQVSITLIDGGAP